MMPICSSRLRLFVYCLVLSPMLFNACACTSSGGISLFGYTSDSQFDTSLKTIRVPVFKNETFYRGLEFQLTEAVIKKIEARTPWKVVQQGYCDAELTGTIKQVQKRVPLVNPLNEVREGEYTLTVEVTFTDLRGGPSAPMPLANSEIPSAGTLPTTKPFSPPKNLIVRSRAFIPELGQSTATARQQVVEDLAEQIVNMLENPW
ncbi:hypothetical protein HRbin36_01036 [bacterium HR36]|nr:hypothetical protein HRbin36_01036 [bacterium HR36]